MHNEKKLLCRRCSVPLRVPMVGAYRVFCRIHNREKMRVLLKGCRLHAVTAESYTCIPEGRIKHTANV